jgi:fatty acid desaturase
MIFPTIIAMIEFLIVAAFAKMIMDKLQFHFSSSVFSLLPNQQFWDPKLSHRNKYKDGKKENGPRFPLATTVLVFTTDAWHLAQFVFLNSMFAVLSIPFVLVKIWLVPVVFISTSITFRVIFEKGFSGKLLSRTKYELT